MAHSVVHLLGIPFAIIAGTGAGVFALLSWGIFRHSPFGTAVALLSLGMAGVTIYHTVLLVAGPDPLLHHVVRSAANTIVAAVLGALILRHHLRRRTRPAGERS